jgi:two-component SAPR family response regulator
LRSNVLKKKIINDKEGLDLMQELQPDILLLDNNLPDGDGWEIVDRFVELFPQIRIYLISAHRGFLLTREVCRMYWYGKKRSPCRC